jgi:septal ring factor EnvC (AmiA/AmiB activator)|tara:strand:- start:10 stop:390 length:381 start_codon:yes stop_codon:yes gene_type:complete
MFKLYIIIAIVAIIGIFGYGAFYTYNDIMSRMATLRSNNAKMEVAIQSKDAVINEIQNNLNKQIELTKNLQSGLQRIELENTRIKDQIDEINILENSIQDTIETEKTINAEIDLIFDAITNSTTGK